MILLLKIVLIATLLGILYQDIKEHQIYWFLPLCIGISSGSLFFLSTLPQLFLSTIVLNILMIGFVLLGLYFYVRIKLRMSFKDVFGIGDVFFFLMISVSISNISFYILFIGSLIFSLALHLVITKNKKESKVPLAGYMSGFFIITFLSFWLGFIDNLYSL